MKIIKRDGRVVDYDRQKISIAIEKANQEVKGKEKATKEEIKNIIEYIEDFGKKRMLVEDVQDIIEEKLMDIGKYELAKKYIVYRCIIVGNKSYITLYLFFIVCYNTID